MDSVRLDTDSHFHKSSVNFHQIKSNPDSNCIQSKYDDGRDGVVFAYFSGGELDSGVEVAHLDSELETATVGKLQNGTWLENPRAGKVTGIGERRQVQIRTQK